MWKAASLLWRTVGRRRGETPRDVVVGLRSAFRAKPGSAAAASNAGDGAARAGADVGARRRPPDAEPARRRHRRRRAVLSRRRHRARPRSRRRHLSAGRSAAHLRRHRAAAVRRVDGRGVSAGTTASRGAGPVEPAAARCPSGWPEWAASLAERSRAAGHRAITRPSAASSRR